eukprot:ANDGO_04100.mRNA.1 hypothetical protein
MSTEGPGIEQIKHSARFLENSNLAAALDADFGRFTAVSIDAVPQFTVDLSMNRLQFFPDFLAALPAFKTRPELVRRICRLDVSVNVISSIPASARFLENLTVLNLSQNCISDLSVAEFPHSLETLILDYNSISDMAPLGSCRCVKVLSLCGNNISVVSGLDSLGSSLQVLRLKDNPIYDISGLYCLTSSPSIKVLEIDCAAPSTRLAPEKDVMFHLFAKRFPRFVSSEYRSMIKDAMFDSRNGDGDGDSSGAQSTAVATVKVKGAASEGFSTEVSQGAVQVAATSPEVVKMEVQRRFEKTVQAEERKFTARMKQFRNLFNMFLDEQRAHFDGYREFMEQESRRICAMVDTWQDDDFAQEKWRALTLAAIQGSTSMVQQQATREKNEFEKIVDKI